MAKHDPFEDVRKRLAELRKELEATSAPEKDEPAPAPSGPTREQRERAQLEGGVPQPGVPDPGSIRGQIAAAQGRGGEPVVPVTPRRPLATAFSPLTSAANSLAAFG